MSTYAAYVEFTDDTVTFRSPCPEREAFSTISYSLDFVRRHSRALIASCKQQALHKAISPRFAEIIVHTLIAYKEEL